MISEQRKEAIKLAATLINTIAAAYLLSGLVAPFLPGAGGTSLMDIVLRVCGGFMVHMLAQGVLYLGLRDSAPFKGDPNESNSSNVDNRLGLGDGDSSDFGGLSSTGQVGQRESAKPEDLER